MTPFSKEAWQRTAHLRAAIHQLPFNVELAAGSLSRDRFRTDITQDAIYLGQFSRVLAISAAKAPDTATLQSFAQSALGAIAVEQALHSRYLRDFDVDPATVVDTEPSPDCLAYTSYLIAAAQHEPWEILVAALLRASGSVGMSAALSHGLQPPKTRTRRGSTPMPTRALARRCVR